MSRGSDIGLSNDFDEVLSYFQEKGILPTKLDAQTKDACRKLHRLTFTLILWRFLLKKIPPHGVIFIEEIASDALQIFPQLVMGYSKTVKLLMRGILENTLRHIYFSDHPIEFERMNRESKWYLSNEQLIDYAKFHPAFTVTEPKFNALARLQDVYSNLSAGIHGRAVKDLETRIALQKIKYDHASAINDIQLLENCVLASNFLLSIFQQRQVLNFKKVHKSLILRTMPVIARKTWSEYEP